MTSSTTCVLLDTSGSMSSLVGRQRRIDVLAGILRTVLPQTPGARLFAFDSVVREIEPTAPVPEPGGGTNLHAALTQIAPLAPVTVIVVSDGVPDDADAAFAAARKLRCRIVTYFAGDEHDHRAVAFLRALAWQSADGLGHAAIADLRDAPKLAAELTLRLGGPDR
jgi:hypothetical protein